jgi:hypothetical protein
MLWTPQPKNLTNGEGSGTGDLEPWMPSLAFDLEKRRGWTRVMIGIHGEDGDVGIAILISGYTSSIW